MSSFLSDLGANPLLLSSLAGSLLAAVACGAIGPLVVTRRMVFLAGAIAHTALAGIGAALYARHRWGWEWLDPLHGAALVALAAGVLLAWIAHRVQAHLDTLIGALWSVGMAVGIVLVKFTPGYHVELMSYLFGNLGFIAWGDVALLAALDVAILVLLLAWYKRIVAVGLDPEHARLQGVSALATDAVLLALVALAVVALTRVVGLILVIALLALPAATAARGVHRLGPLMAVSTALCVLLVTVPRLAVYGTRVAPEAAVILSAAALYGLVLGAGGLRRRAAGR